MGFHLGAGDRVGLLHNLMDHARQAAVIQRLSWWAMGLCCVAALLQPYVGNRAIMALFISLILASNLVVWIGISRIQEDYQWWREQPIRDNAWRYEKEAGL